MTLRYATNTLKAVGFAFLVLTIVCCNNNNSNSKKVPKTDSSINIATDENKGSIPDSILNFLLTSSANDFHSHRPPTPIDFRSLKIGYLMSESNEKSFILCGEFLSLEKNEKEEWNTFATIKTSGYEQYIGNQTISYCQQATFVLTNDANLSAELKKRLSDLDKQK
jgi:hypothetical protein